MLTYWFYPLPGNANYSNPKVIFLLVICLLLFSLSFFISHRRKHASDAVFRRLSRSWAGALRGFSIIALVLIVARVEDVQFLSMRFLWILWVLVFVAYGLLQFWLFRKRHYSIQPRPVRTDPREEYLPKPGSAKR